MICDNPKCRDCRPILIGENGPLPDSHPLMMAVDSVWYELSMDERTRFYDAMAHGEGREDELVERVVRRVQLRITN